MNGTHCDQALTAALAHSLGHAAPFSESECRNVTALALTHCHEISDLAWCPNLRSLEISNSDIHDLRFVEALPHLVSGELGDDPRALDLTRLPEIGTAADALGWIQDSSIPDAPKDHYRQFVAHFPHLTFCRGTTALMGCLADAAERYAPEWFAASLATLPYALPFQGVEFQFFEDQVDDFERLKPWHALQFNTRVSKQFVNAGASMRPVTIAEGVHGSTSGLAIDAASARAAIYSYDRDMYEELDAGLDVAFASYAKMLAGLRAMRIVCGEKIWTINAQTV